MLLSFTNGAPVALKDIPTLPFGEFADALTSADFPDASKRVLALWKLPDGRIACVLGNPASRKLEIFSTSGETYSGLTERIPALHRFERELNDAADAHPNTPLKGIVAHEVAVGPVHAGVIEPGHFRFQCMGEDVHYLEIRLGYQHRGAEALIAGAKSDLRRLALAETVAGDTSIAASLACAKVLQLPDVTSCQLFTLLLELERIANHVGDLGALSGDVAYLPTASFCGRIRGEYLNMTAEFCGNRFGRGAFFVSSPSQEAIDRVNGWFRRTEGELFHALDLLFSEVGAVERFENTGRVSADVARSIGLTGMAGRASGLKVDSRIDFPLEGELIHDTLVCGSEMSGDVLSRARQRYEELKVSHALVRRFLNQDIGALAAPQVDLAAKPEGETVTVAVVEGWRGELVHVAVRAGANVTQYKVFDPSYHNWFGLAQALRGEQISNFPICNKSFNLSYCGVDR